MGPNPLPKVRRGACKGTNWWQEKRTLERCYIYRAFRAAPVCRSDQWAGSSELPAASWYSHLVTAIHTGLVVTLCWILAGQGHLPTHKVNLVQNTQSILFAITPSELPAASWDSHLITVILGHYTVWTLDWHLVVVTVIHGCSVVDCPGNMISRVKNGWHLFDFREASMLINVTVKYFWKEGVHISKVINCGQVSLLSRKCYFLVLKCAFLQKKQDCPK